MQFRLTLRLAGMMLILPALFSADENQFVENMENSKRRNEQLAESDLLGEPLGEDDLEAAKLIDVQDSLDPREQDELTADDMLFKTPEPGSDYNAVKSPDLKWPKATIPYVISEVFNRQERAIITKAMKMFHDKTCIRFKPRSSESSYIHLLKGFGCESYVGRIGGSQHVSLDWDCFTKSGGIVVHELMHAAGFYHEQGRYDRGKHVRIITDNIKKGYKYSFRMLSDNEIDNLNAPYDICSIMHYGPYAASKDRRSRPTIIAIGGNDKCMGQRKGFSYWDIRKLNTLYKCSGKPQVNSRRTG